MKVEVCGVEFDSLTLAEAVAAAEGGAGRACRVVTPNAVMLERCRREPALRELLNTAELVLPDGVGVVRAAERMGRPLRERVAGIDFGEALLRRAAERGEPVFLLGGRPGVAERAGERLRERMSGLCICGTADGYFEKRGRENEAILERVRTSGAELLLVCLGFPEQERWMAENLPQLPGVRVAAGLGGSLDVWANDRRRAPKFFQKLGLEWAWRMLADPRKLRQLPLLLSFAGQNLKKSRKNDGKMHS